MKLKGGSKRQKLAQKYNIDKKAREHRRKMRKQAAKNKSQGKAKKKNKMPNIPNLFPYKQEEINKINKKREDAINRKKELRKSLKEVQIASKSQKADEDSNSPNDEAAEDEDEDRRKNMINEVSHLFSNVMQRQQNFISTHNSKEENSDSFVSRYISYGDFSSGSEFRELNKLLNLVDVVIEVLDCRDPENCRCLNLERSLIASGKKVILLLNKIDLIPRSALSQWLKYLRREFPTVAFKASISSSADRSHHSKASPSKISDAFIKSNSHVFGASALLQLLKNYSRCRNTKLSISVGIVGYPNVGKSSVINSLLRSVSVVKVGGEAGVTRKLQEVQLDKKIRLFDSPGVIFRSSADSSSLILGNNVKLSRVKDPESVVAELIPRIPKEFLLKFFDIDDFEDTHDFLSKIAYSRGKLVKGGMPDFLASAFLVLSCWTTGKMGFYVLPPKIVEDKNAETTVVERLAPSILDEFGDIWKDEDLAIEEFYENNYEKNITFDNVDKNVTESEEKLSLAGYSAFKNENNNSNEKISRIMFNYAAIYDKASRNISSNSKTIFNRIKKRRRRALVKAKGDDIANSHDIVEKHLSALNSSFSLVSAERRKKGNRLWQYDSLETHSSEEDSGEDVLPLDALYY